MTVYRIARSVYAVLDGEGARRYGGRWNQRGTPAIYASEHISLAVLEVLVHVDPDDLPGDLHVYRIVLPDTIDEVDELPSSWREDISLTQEVGERWLERDVLAFRVPSAIVPQEYNAVINPMHEEARRLAVDDLGPFIFDTRLL